MKKLNCWEFKKCGREPEGRSVKDLGVCLAAKEKRLDGIHEGNNAGRSCWVIVGTSCEKKGRTLAEKLSLCCIECDFYNKVREEEGAKFILAPLLLQKIRGMAGDEAIYHEDHRTAHPHSFKHSTYIRR